MILKVVGAILAAVVVVVAAFAALIYFGIGPNPFIGLFLDPPEHSARYYPRDTIAYGWLTLYPQGGQFEQMMDLFERFNELPGMEDRFEDLQDEVEDESGFNFEEELDTWVGVDLSVGLWEERDQPVGVMTVSVRDFENAQVFMDGWTDFLEDEESFDFDYDDDAGVAIWTDEEQSLAFALTKEALLVVFSDNPDDPLEEMLDLITGRSDRSLAEAGNFQAARQQFSDRRFASAFVDVEELFDLFEDSELLAGEEYDFASLTDSAYLPTWAAMSVQWIDSGIVMEVLWPNTEDFTDELRALDNPAELVPAETIGLLAATFDPNLDNWREQLENYSSDDDASYVIGDIYEELYWQVERQSDNPPRRRNNPDMADVLDLFLELVEVYTEVDLEGDVMDYLEGTLVLAVEEFDASRIEQDPMEETINVVTLLSYLQEEESRLENSLEDFSDFLQDVAPVDVDSEDVGADNDAEIFRVDFFGVETDYSPGYVLHNGQLIFGTTEGALENTVGVQNGEVDDLASLVEYRRSVEALPGDQQLLVWLDLQRIVSQLNAGDLDMTDEDFEALEAALGSIAAGANADEELIRVRVAITFFPE